MSTSKKSQNIEKQTTNAQKQPGTTQTGFFLDNE